MPVETDIDEASRQGHHVTVTWKDSDMETGKGKEGNGSQGSYDENKFVDRQLRRISEIPRISQINVARRQSKHNISFLRKLFNIIGNSCLFKVFFFILRLIPISKIVMWALYLNKCPAEPFILIYLLVGGILAVVRDTVSLLVKHCLSDECVDENEVFLSVVAFLYSTAEFVWFVVGSVFVYKTYGDYQITDNNRGDYCHNVLYWYAFGVTTMSYVLLFMVVFLSICTLCVARCVDKPTPKKSPGT